jgi:glycosyltransferase involved in cell wall biosynthesis
MSGRLRVLYVVDNLGVGGVQEVALSDLRSLDQGRFELGLLTLADDLDIGVHDLPEHVVPLAAAYRPEYGYGLIDYVSDGVLMRGARRYGDQALEQIASFSPQVLHFHTHPRDLGLGILASRRMPTTLVFTDHIAHIRPEDYSPHARFILRHAFRRLYRRCDVISVGTSVQGYHRESRLLNPSRQHLLLENEIDLDKFHPPPSARPLDPVEVIQVARLQANKGTETVLRAFGRLTFDGHLRCTLVGPDAMGGEMQRLAEECVADPLEVRFLGARNDVADLLRGASIGVLMSRREGLPLAVLEMMATGLPAVVSDIPEHTAIVSDGVDGLVVPLDDVEALAMALQRLINDPDLRRRIGTAARTSAEQRMTGRRIPKLEAFYETVAARG